MSGLDFLWAALYFLPALVWAIVGETSWRLLRTRRPRSTFFRLLPILCATMALNFGLNVVFALLQFDADRPLAPHRLLLSGICDLCGLASATVFRHMACFFPMQETPPRRGWLAVNYGSGVAMAALTVVTLLVPALVGSVPRVGRLPAYQGLYAFYLVVMLGVASRNVGRMALRGGWRPGGLGVVNRLDLVVLVAGMLVIGGLGLLVLWGGWEAHPSVMHLLSVMMGLLFAVPIAVRTLGEVVRGLLLTGAMMIVGATGAVGIPHLVAGMSPELRPLVGLAAVVALVVAIVPGQSWLRAEIDQLVFRRTRRRRAEVQTFLHTLSPELGVRDCCRRALADIRRVWQLRGAAILLADGEALVAGEVELDAIRRVWPQAAAAGLLPTRSMVAFELRDLPLVLKEAMFESDIVEVVPIASPRRRWGHLFIRTGLLGATYNDENVQAIEAFADQLALILDGTDLLARAVAVERALAHSEKLAAIGELSARIAHEIRNPVTAARSLAQQLCRDPTAPGNAESAAVIVQELERIERQVAALLRFARREDFRFEPVELGELVRTTVEAFGARLEAAEIRLRLDVDAAVTVRADREKLRQVLVNLLENAIDALAGHAGERSLSVAVGNGDAGAVLRMRDTGPGVPAEALPHLFEPFFSLKETGTGLGLAIVKRTVEAHGGRIAVAGGAGAGMTFEIALPREDPG